MRLVFKSRNVGSEEQYWPLDADINTHLGYCLDRQKSKSFIACYCSKSFCTGLKLCLFPYYSYIKFANLTVHNLFRYSQALIHFHKLKSMVNYNCRKDTASQVHRP